MLATDEAALYAGVSIRTSSASTNPSNCRQEDARSEQIRSSAMGSCHPGGLVDECVLGETQDIWTTR